MYVLEQRRTRRFDLRLPIVIQYMGNEWVRQHSETRNLSSGGVLFCLDSEVPVGQSIEYTITLPPTGKEPQEVRLHCVGTVVRSEQRPGDDTMQPKYAVAATLERYEFVREGR